MDELAVQEHLHELSSAGVFSSMTNFKEMYDIGKMFASSTLVPQAYQGKAMDCTIAVDMANRMGVSPMMVMQNLYVVKGKPSWSGQACKTLIDSSGKFRNACHIYTGERNTDTWGCYVRATRVEDGEVIHGVEVTMAMAKEEGWTSNKKWHTMPELMLAYRASAFFARVHIPNALMGVSVEGEVEDITKSERIETTDSFFEETGIVVDEKLMEEAEGIFE